MDNYVIKELKRKYDLTKDEDVLALYAKLQSGEYDLSDAEGRRFDDEVYELAMQARERQRQNRSGSKKKITRSSGKQDKKKSRRKVVVLTRGELRARRLLTAVLVVAAMSCLAYFGIYYYDSYKAQQLSAQLTEKKNDAAVNRMYGQTQTVQENADGQQIMLTVLDEYKSLYNQNKNLIGWLEIADTNIDYPVMQTADNEYYLDHNINQEEDKNGTLFLDSACDVVKPSTNFIIYGHNMRSGNMFGNLDKYKSESYYKDHPMIRFDTIYEKGTYQVMYAFMSHIYKEDEIAFKYYQFIDAASEQEFDSDMRSMQEMALYDTGVTAQYGDRLLTLSTCDYEESDGRFVVVAKRME